MSKRNWPLVVGGALTLLFAILALAGPRFAPHDPLETNLYLRYNGGIHMVPVTPFEVAGYPLGTDEAGRDVLSRILWGIRPTLLICVVVALARLALGVTVGVIAGWFRGTTERVVDAVGSVGIGLPPLVLALALIFVLGVERGATTFVVALTLVGWVEVANLVKAQTLTVVQASYVESARALGVGPWGVVRRHLLPQLRPLVPVLLAFELSAALLILTELGFLGIFIGGGTTYQFDAGGIKAIPVLTSNTPELAQQISRFWTKFYRVPWEFLAVGALIFRQIVAFNLVGEGLRRRLDVTQPRPRRRWLRVPDRVLDRVPQPSWRWIPVGAVVVAALLVGARVYTQPRAALPADQPQAGTNTVASATLLSDNPLPTDQLSTVDIEQLLIEAGAVPDQFRIQQVSKRVPDVYRDVPQPVDVRGVSLTGPNTTRANVTVFLYATAEERDQAVQMVAKAVRRQAFLPEDPLPSPNPSPIAGDRSLALDDCSIDDTNVGVECKSELGTGLALSANVIFERCSAVVDVRLTSGTSVGHNEATAALAQAVDRALTPLVCQPEGATVASTPTFSDDPLPANQLSTVDLEAFMQQPDLLPDRMTISQVSQRVPDQFRAVPPAVQVRNFTVEKGGVNAGNIVVFLYESVEDRARAAPIIQAVTLEQHASLGAPGSSIGSWVMARCSAVVQVRLVATADTLPQPDPKALADALETQLAPLVCRPADALAGTNAAPSVAAQPTAPRSADELRAVDLEALMTQPDVFPPNYSAGPFSKRVPDQLRDVPEPVQVRNATLKNQGLNAGNIVVLLYGSVTERDQAMQTAADLIANQNGFSAIEGPSPPPQQPDATPVAGERSFTFGLLPPGATFEGGPGFFGGPPQVIFARCGAVVHLRTGANSGIAIGDKLDESLASIIRSLDERLTPLVCQ